MKVDKNRIIVKGFYSNQSIFSYFSKKKGILFHLCPLKRTKFKGTWSFESLLINYITLLKQYKYIYIAEIIRLLISWHVYTFEIKSYNVYTCIHRVSNSKISDKRIRCVRLYYVRVYNFEFPSPVIRFRDLHCNPSRSCS